MTTMVDHFLECLRLAPEGEGRFRVASLRDVGEGDVVFGGQMVAQMMVAAATVDATKPVKYVSALLGRPAVRREAMVLGVEAMHGGRAFATVAVTVSQNDRLLARGQVLLSADEPDTIRHGLPAPVVEGPGQCPAFDGVNVGPTARATAGRELRIVGGYRPGDPELVREPSLRMWGRCAGLDDDPVHSQAFVAFACAGPNISTTMMPHKGFGTDLAHESISTGIMTHTVTFHERFDARQWLLFDHLAAYAGHGRGYARGDIFTADGALAASFVQDSMIRAYPKDAARMAAERTVL